MINYFSTVVGHSLPSFSYFGETAAVVVVVVVGGGGWLGATHDKCCPYYWSRWKTGPGNIRLQQANHTLCIPRGQKRLARYKPLFTLQRVIEKYSRARLVCDVSLNRIFPF